MNRAVVRGGLPELCPEKVEAVVINLGEFGIKGRDDVQCFREANLAEGGLLKAA